MFIPGDCPGQCGTLVGDGWDKGYKHCSGRGQGSKQEISAHLAGTGKANYLFTFLYPRIRECQRQNGETSWANARVKLHSQVGKYRNTSLAVHGHSLGVGSYSCWQGENKVNSYSDQLKLGQVCKFGVEFDNIRHVGPFLLVEVRWGFLFFDRGKTKSTPTPTN